MDTRNLAGKRVAVLVTDGFELNELEEPRRALKAAGAEAVIVSPSYEPIKGWDGDRFGVLAPVDVQVAEADYDDFDALFLPGGVMNADKLRQSREAVEFVRSFFDTGKPVAALCHGVQILIDAKAAQDRKLTSYPSLKNDLLNAGADWLDGPVVVDNGLVTARRPDDMGPFNEQMITEFAKGIHAPQPAWK